MKFTLDDSPGFARVYEFGGKQAGLELIVCRRLPEPTALLVRTDPRRLAAMARLRNGRTIKVQFKQTGGPMNAGEAYETDVAEFGPKVRLSDIDQIVIAIDGVRRGFRIMPGQRDEP